MHVMRKNIHFQKSGVAYETKKRMVNATELAGMYDYTKECVYAIFSNVDAICQCEQD